MTSPNGYIKLHRKVLESGILKNHRLWAFWTWCLLKASHQDHDQIVGNQVIHLSPGQFIFGRKAAAHELRMTEKQVRLSLDFCLNVDQNMTIQRTNKFSIITLVNWDTYQSRETEEGQQEDQQRANKGPTKGQQRATNKNGKKGKNGKKEDIGDDAQFWLELRHLYTWINFDVEIAKMKAYQLTPRGSKWKMTKRSVVNWLNRIDKPVGFEGTSHAEGESYAERRLRERGISI